MDCNLKTLLIFITTELQPDDDKLAGVKQDKRFDNAGNTLFFFRFFLIFNITLYEVVKMYLY
jgi:hypothetical protein